MAQQQLLRQEPSVSQTLRTYKKQLTQSIDEYARLPILVLLANSRTKNYLFPK
jgi:hypothetical protein